MDSLLIKGATPLSGEVRVSGAKNACLPMFAAALLTDEKCVLKNVPNLSDVRFMADIVRAVGAEVSNPSEGVWEICAKNLSHIAPYELVRKMRASICLLGPLSARMKKAEVSLPGGCWDLCSRREEADSCHGTGSGSHGCPGPASPATGLWCSGGYDFSGK